MSDVRAGKAYFEVGLGSTKAVEAKFRKLSGKLSGIGAGLRSVGTAGLAASGALLAGFGGAALTFAKTGDALDKMSARTGVTVEELQELGFAAEQSGAGAAGLEKGLRGMSRTILDAERGLATAKDNLSDLGLTLDDLEGKSPAEQFELFADRVSKVEDPTRRSALAMKVFGRSGADLLPLMMAGGAGIAQLRGEARELGIVMGEDQTKAAAAMTDAMNRVWRQVTQLGVQIGAAVAGPLTWLLDFSKQYLAVAIRWVRENSALVAGVAAAGAVVAGLSVGLIGLGAALSLAAVGLGGLATLFGALFSPLGLVTAGLAAGVTYFALYTETGQAMAASLSGYFGELWEIAQETFGGIKSALESGDTEAATEILFAGLRVLWLKGTAPLREAWGDVTRAMWKGFRTVKDNLLGAADSLWTSLTIGLNSLLAAFEITWAKIKGLFGGDATAEIDRINRELEASNAILAQGRDERKRERERQRREEFAEADGAGDAKLREAQRELDRLRQDLATKAAEARSAAARGAKVAAAEAEQGIKQAEARKRGPLSSSAGTFNAAAIASLLSVGAGSAQERAATAAEESLEEQKEQTRLLGKRLVMGA